MLHDHYKTQVKKEIHANKKHSRGFLDWTAPNKTRKKRMKPLNLNIFKSPDKYSSLAQVRHSLLLFPEVLQDDGEVAKDGDGPEAGTDSTSMPLSWG